MDDKTQKERLEQELRFLNESFEAEVISKEEFEKGKERIEKKLKELEKSVSLQSAKEQKIDFEEEEQQKKDKTEEARSYETIDAKEPEKIRLNVIQDEVKEEGKRIETEPVKIEEKQVKEAEEKSEAKAPIEKNQRKLIKYGIIFIVLMIITYFSYSFFKPNALKTEEQKQTELMLIGECNSNADCKQENKTGICLEPGTVNAKCELKDIQKTNVLVLTDRKNCFNCETERILEILQSWFGAINVKEIDYSLKEGKNLAERLDIKLLPAYVFDENISNQASFDQFKQAFIKKDKSYLLSDDAAASTFYLKRENIPNKLDLFVVADEASSSKAENNLKEFLEAFKNTKFEKHLPNDKLTVELGIRTFPVFLINNRIKFTGVQSAETIKNNFCQMNRLPECEKNLTKSLI